MTTPSAVVKNTFRVTSADGGVLSEERLRDLRKAVVTCASKSYSTLKSAAANSKVRVQGGQWLRVRVSLCGLGLTASGSAHSFFPVLDDGRECGGDVV